MQAPISGARRCIVHFFHAAPHREDLALDSSESARRLADAAVEKKASDVVMLDIRGLSILADFFIICTGTNPRQIAAIGDAMDEELSKAGGTLLHREGQADSGWLLLDFGDVICHIFGPKEREFYQLERLWAAAPRLTYVE
jgi:ribosome-associated protein